MYIFKHSTIDGTVVNCYEHVSGNEYIYSSYTLQNGEVVSVISGNAEAEGTIPVNVLNLDPVILTTENLRRPIVERLIVTINKTLTEKRRELFKPEPYPTEGYLNELYPSSSDQVKQTQISFDDTIQLFNRYVLTAFELLVHTNNNVDSEEWFNDLVRGLNILRNLDYNAYLHVRERECRLALGQIQLNTVQEESV